MNQQFRNQIFKAVKQMMQGANTEITMNEEEQILSAVFHKLGEYEGSMLTQMNFLKQYNGEDAEVFQFFTVLAGGVKEELFETVESKLNELNQNCMFGHFVLHRGLKQVFFRYSIPLKNDEEAYSIKTLQFVWEEIFGIMTYFLAYVLLICNEPDYMTLQQYMEDIGENI